MNVLVYSGPDISPTSLAHTSTSLRTLLAPNYAVQPTDQKALHTQPWAASCALLVLPPFSATGSFTLAARAEIQKYITGGGNLLALGTGVLVTGRRGMGGVTGLSFLTQLVSLSIRTSVPVSTPEAPFPPEKLALEDRDAKGSTISLVPSLHSEHQSEAGASTIQFADGSQLEGVLRGGVLDVTQAETSSERIQPLAHYVSGDASEIAAMRASVDLGVAVFWSVHIETPITNDPVQEKMRQNALRVTLETLGLRVPQVPGERLEVVPRPTPQILSGAPWRAGVVDAIVCALQVPDLASAVPYKFKDRHDTFLLYSKEAAAGVFAEQREAVKTWGDDPETWNPKHIVVYGDDAIPPKDLTPKFDISAYYEELKEARRERGCRETYKNSAWGVGEALLYGESVTSTQTMLDRNTRLLETLPTPFLSLASTQLTGRGRGANVWLSPPGCLMFSLLLRVPLAVLPAQKLVFIQYLFALAVVEACRADRVLGDEAGSRVRIKWPNDIYGIAGDGERKKLGGILVNTSFGAGKVEIVIGCGLNVLNDPPILSLAQLLPGGRALPTMEHTLAAIVTRFERMWNDFLYARGSFEPFMDLYLQRWLHSDQEVTLTTTMPPREVRIVGITPDHGLLRTVAELGQEGGTEYLDLQPDGNSFDLLAGLIKTKDHERGPSPSCWTTNDSISMQHSVFPVLPLDIFEAVIDHASDTSASLRHLSLTCSAFLPRARYHLFSSIVIQTVRQLESSGEFLDSHPWLMTLVRAATLRLTTGSKYQVLGVVPVQLLSRLPKLRALRMESDHFQSPLLSLHRLTISCLRRYGSGIQNLELSNICFEHMSDYTGLVSAFTCLQRLTCLNISLRTVDEHSLNSSVLGPETNVRRFAQPPRIQHLHIGPGVHISVVRYPLASSASTLDSLVLTVNFDTFPGNADGSHHLETLTGQLSRLSSLTVVISGKKLTLQNADSKQSVMLNCIRYARRILQRVERSHLSDVHVEFELSTFASLGCWLSKESSSTLEACKGLEDVLLSFRTPGCILFRRPSSCHRAGRAQFWCPTLKRAFPRLHEQGLVIVTRAGVETPSDPPGHEGEVTCLAASNDSKRIATASRDGTIIVWDTECGTIEQEWVAHRGCMVHALAFSPDSVQLLSAGDGTSENLAVWDLSGGIQEPVAAPQGHTAAVTSCASSPDGALIASASEDGTVRVWDARTFQQVALLEDAEAVSDPRSLQFSPDGSYLAWRRELPGRCTVWRPLAAVGEQPRMMPSRSPSSHESVAMRAFAFDPEGRTIATADGARGAGPVTGSSFSVVRVWDIETGALLAVLPLAGHSGDVDDVSFAPDGRFLVSASGDGRTKVWDTDSWEETASLDEDGEDTSTVGTPSRVWRACFSPDGKFVATASWLGTVRLWRTCDASCAAVFTEHCAEGGDPKVRVVLRHVAFSPNGAFLASGDQDGRVYIRHLSDFI